MKRTRSQTKGDPPGPPKKKPYSQQPPKSDDEYASDVDRPSSKDDSSQFAPSDMNIEKTAKDELKGKKGRPTPRTQIRHAGFNPRRRETTGRNLRKADILDSGARFTASSANQPIKQTMTYAKLNNLERFQAVMKRHDAASLSQSAPQQQQSASTPQSTTEQAALAVVKQMAALDPLEIDFIFQQPMIDKRDYQYMVNEEKSNNKTKSTIWKFEIRYKQQGQRKWTAVFKKETLKADWTEAQIRNILTSLISILERWPYPIGSKDISLKRMLFDAACRHAEPGRGKISIIKLERPTQSELRFEIDSINPETGKLQEIALSINAKSFPNLCKPIPSLPSNVVVGRVAADSALQGAFTDQKRNCVKFIQFVQYTLHDKLASKDDLVQAYMDLQNEYFGKIISGQVTKANRVKKTPRRVEKWYTFNHLAGHRRMLFYPSASMLALQNIALSPIFVRTDSRARIITVTKAMDQARQMDPVDPIAAWTQGCIAADLINESIKRGDPPPVQCMCENEAESNSTMHSCLACFTSVICTTLTVDERGDRICQDCAAGKEERAAAMIESNLTDRIRTLVYAEARFWTSSEGKTVQEMRDEAKSMIEIVVQALCAKVVDAQKIQDVYTGIMRTCLPEPRAGPREDPFWVSPDAVFPYGIFANERRLHSPENVEPTARWINHLKHFYIPAVLAVLATFLCSKHIETDFDRLLRDMDDVYRCLKALGYLRSQRLSVKHKARLHSNDLRMWQSGIPPTFSKRAEAKLYKYIRIPVTEEDVANIIDKPRLNKIIAQIEDRFSVSLPRSADGCAWPGIPATMPHDWSWPNCWSFFTTRQHREWSLCNKDFVQCDTPEKLYLECIWQFCDPTYKDFLGLPFVLYELHPLRLAVGKKVHGQQMCTGWSIYPTSIDDRQESVNNVLFEVCLSNFAKGYFPNSDYPAMLAEVPQINVPKAYFDPELRNRLLAERDAGTIDEEIDAIDDIPSDDENPEDDAGGAAIDMDQIAAREGEGVEDFDDNEPEEEAVSDDQATPKPPPKAAAKPASKAAPKSTSKATPKPATRTSSKAPSKPSSELSSEDLSELSSESFAEDAPPSPNVGITDLDNDDLNSAMISIETDIHTFATHTASTTRSSRSGLRGIAIGIIVSRRGDLDDDDDDMNMFYDTIINRITQQVGPWGRS